MQLSLSAADRHHARASGFSPSGSVARLPFNNLTVKNEDSVVPP